MAEGLSNRGICEKLVVSPKTVETHVNSIFWKLDLMPAPDEHRRVLRCCLPAVVARHRRALRDPAAGAAGGRRRLLSPLPT